MEYEVDYLDMSWMKKLREEDKDRIRDYLKKEKESRRE